MQHLMALQTDERRGLTDEDARARRNRVGPNELAAEKPVPAWRRFLAQFQDVLVVLLLVATGDEEQDKEAAHPSYDPHFRRGPQANPSRTALLQPCKMPIFEYVCRECEAVFEEFILRSAEESAVVCPECKSANVEKALSAPAVQSRGSSGAAIRSRGCGPIG